MSEEGGAVNMAAEAEMLANGTHNKKREQKKSCTTTFVGQMKREH